MLVMIKMRNFMARRPTLTDVDVNELREILRAYRAAYRNWPSVLLSLALRARAVTRDGRVVEGDDVILGAIARLYALGLGDRAVRKFLRQIVKGSEETTSIVYDLSGAFIELYALSCGLRFCRLVNVADDLSYIIIKMGERRSRCTGDIEQSSAPILIIIIMHLDVKGKSLLEVGAFIGDSSLLFAAMGARRVVAVEPLPLAYQAAKKNVEANGLDGVITLVNCAVNREDSRVLMLPSGEVGTGFQATATPAGDVPVPTCTLDSLIEKYGPFDVLEMDCEGCEYESIPYSRRIGEVKEILIEYHGGYEDIVRS